MKKSVEIEVLQRKRDVVVSLGLRGYQTIEEAVQGIVKHLTENGVNDEGGVIEEVKEDGGVIEVETDICGFGICPADIERAIAAKGELVRC